MYLQGEINRTTCTIL